MSKGTQKSPLAGNWISDQIRLLLSQSQPPIPLTPHYLVSSKSPVDAGATPQATYKTFATPPHESFRRLQEERVLTEFKESCVQVWNPARLSGSTSLQASIDWLRLQQEPGRPFEMPDGWNNVFGVDRYRVAEGMFDEKAGLTVSLLCAEGMCYGTDRDCPGLQHIRNFTRTNSIRSCESVY